MKVSLNLLKKFVDLSSFTVDEIVHRLTFSGFEVEGVESLAYATNLVIGKIISCVEHKDSDHLHVLKVDLGEKYGVKQIVCGAPNAREGIKVIVARVGAELSKEKHLISHSVIRGEESDGMCCALYELGVDKSLLSEKQCSGIEELDLDAPIGEENVLEYLGLDDTILDINVLANRPDVLSLYSFAKEVGALFNLKVNIPEYTIASSCKSEYRVLSKTEHCKQFALRVIKNVKVKESPEFLKKALRSQGIRSINNIVDIGNYVMLLTGRPLHMYDLDKIDTKEFVVRDDLNEDFVALDEKTYKVINGDIVITDGTKPLCLGGIMGAQSCMIDNNSKNIAIECATFTSHIIRHTSSRIGLSSDSSSRFVKGINPVNHIETLELATYLLKEYADAEIFEEIVDYDVRNYQNNPVMCSYSYINHRLGTNISHDDMDEEFEKLSIHIEHIDEDNFKAFVPSYRTDLKIDADLSEEIFRTIGLDKIKPTLPLTPMTLGGLTPFQNKKRIIREHLISHSLNEVLTYSLVSNKDYNKLVSITLNDEPYVIKNPMTVEHSIVRKGLLLSLIDVVKLNISRQENNLGIFETSLIETKNRSFLSLGIVLHGMKTLQGGLRTKEYDFYDLTGILNSILNVLGINKNRLKITRGGEDFLHPGRSMDVYLNKNLVAYLGELHPNKSKELEIDKTYVMEINLTELINLKSSMPKMSLISKYPFVKRDYAFVISKNVLIDDILLTIKKNSSSIVINQEVFDVYEGEHVIESYKSVALRLTYQALDHTLKEEEINNAEEKVLQSIIRLGGQLRK